MKSIQEIRQSLWESSKISDASRKIDLPCLMVIDDHPDILISLQFVLADNYQVLCYSSYEEAKPEITENLLAILLDIKMIPDGKTIFHKIHDQFPNLPIIFHSSYPGSHQIKKEIDHLPHAGYFIKGNYTVLELQEHLQRLPSTKKS